MRAVSYSPYRSSTSVDRREFENITDTQIKEDLDLLVKAGFGLIRIFASNDQEGIHILRVLRANNIPLKVMLGAYVNSFEYDTNLTPAKKAAIQQANDDEIARTVTLANAYKDEVAIISVGNETQVDWSFVKISSRALSKYIATVRAKVTQPVGTDEDSKAFAGDLPFSVVHHAEANSPAEVLAQLDFLSIHVYPSEDALYSGCTAGANWSDWDWKQSAIPEAQRAQSMMDAAVRVVKTKYALVRSNLDRLGKGYLPIIIGESGWKAAMPSVKSDPTCLGSNRRYKFMANPVNQKRYFDGLMQWAVEAKNTNGPKNIIWFEAFDEIWKGSDDKWGLFNVDRSVRYAIQGKNSASSTWVYDSTSTADNTYWKATTQNIALNASQYTLFADKSTTGESKPTVAWDQDLHWDPFANTTITTVNTANASSDTAGTNSIEIQPKPEAYGWGALIQSSAETTVNLSSFGASSSLRFSIKTTYAGNLEVGFSTLTEAGDVEQVLLVFTSSNKYGYVSDGAWHDVSIPIAAFSAANPNIDIRLLLARFIIADRYDYTKTSKAQQDSNTANDVRILIDNIYWSK